MFQLQIQPAMVGLQYVMCFLFSLVKTSIVYMPKIEIFNEDCLNTLKRIEDKSIDLILQDPPYNTTDNEWECKLNFELLWAEWNRIIKNNGAIIMTANQPFTTDLINSNRKQFKYHLIWDKMRTSASQLCNIRPLPAHEEILIFGTGKITYNPIKKIGIKQKKGGFSGKHTDNYKSKTEMNRNENNEYYPISILSFLACHNMTGKFHPTEKPIDLFRYLIKTYSNENENVFDGFSGSGTTAHACLKENRNFIGAEINKEYFDYSIKRIELERSQLCLSL